MPLKEHVHSNPGDEANAPGWTYTVSMENTFQYAGKTILFIIGNAVIGSACVGAADLQVVIVPGCIVSWHHGFDARGRAVSTIETIEGEREQGKIHDELKTRFPNMQVVFL